MCLGCLYVGTGSIQGTLIVCIKAMHRLQKPEQDLPDNPVPNVKAESPRSRCVQRDWNGQCQPHSKGQARCRAALLPVPFRGKADTRPASKTRSQADL